MNAAIVLRTPDEVEVQPSGRSFETYQRYERARELLVSLNQSEGPDGQGISAMFSWRGFETWWFHQGRLFWDLLEYSRFEPLILHLKENNIGEASLRRDPKVPADRLRALAAILEDENIKVSLGPGERLRTAFNHLLGTAADVTLLFAQSAVSLASFLWIVARKPRTLVYSLDHINAPQRCDFRLSTLYSFLLSRDARFVEVLYSNRGLLETLRNVMVRRRPALYLNVFMHVGSALARVTSPHVGSVPGKEGHCRCLAKRYLERARASCEITRLIYAALGPVRFDRLLSIDDMRYTNELVGALKARSVRTYAFQHGHFTKYHVGWYALGAETERTLSFDTLFLWNDYWRSVLISYSNVYHEGNTCVGGFLRPIPLLERRERRDNERPRVLFLSEPLANFPIAARYARALIDSNRFDVTVKVKPGEDVRVTKRRYLLPEGFDTFVAGDIYEVLADVDVVVGTYSTALYEALYVRVPTVQITEDLSLGEQMVRDGLTVTADKPGTLVDAIERALTLPGEHWIGISERLLGDPRDLSRTLETLLKEDVE